MILFVMLLISTTRSSCSNIYVIKYIMLMKLTKMIMVLIVRMIISNKDITKVS